MKKSNKQILMFVFTISFAFLASDICANPAAVEYQRPVAIDSRIRTLIYSENEVYRIVVHYGYQTVLEFANGEEIQTISAGNNYAWTLTPLGRRLFIKPLEDSIMTNMTIITNLRTYHVDLQSKSMSNVIDEEMAYVVRFFYPNNRVDIVVPSDIEPAGSSTVSTPKVDEQQQEGVVASLRPLTNGIGDMQNSDYTLTGPDDIAPSEVFDDGMKTYFGFSDISKMRKVKIYRKHKNGAMVEAKTTILDKYIMVDAVAEEFILSISNKTVNIYNENYITGGM